MPASFYCLHEDLFPRVDRTLGAVGCNVPKKKLPEAVEELRAAGIAARQIFVQKDGVKRIICIMTTYDYKLLTGRDWVPQ